MKFPSLADLDREQRRIYAEAPNDGAILVVGPPGTGKTIMAFHRAQKMKELGQAPMVIMFGRVLMTYTGSRGEVAKAVPVSTMHTWVDSWWRSAMGRKRAPRVHGSLFDIDWRQLSVEAMQAATDEARARKLDWGHLIIDEGQDFPESMYLVLGLMMSDLAERGLSPRLTVFADDNQRLNVASNSETASIARALFIDGEQSRNYTLKKNFRNTRQIADFAAHFQVGNASGVADRPDRSGELPDVLLLPNDRELADAIARRAKISAGKQIGVIVNGPRRAVTRTYNQIKSRLGEKPFKIQMYLNNEPDHPAENLDFNSPNTVTVLHQNSAKGLEFDIVFYVGLERIDLSTSGGINELMALYVMCSRARSDLYLAFTDLDGSADPPQALGLLPAPTAGLCRYTGVGSFGPLKDEFLGKVRWQEKHNSLLGS